MTFQKKTADSSKYETTGDIHNLSQQTEKIMSLIGTYMWMPIDAGGNVDDGVAVEEHLLGWPGDVGEGQSGVPHHAVA
jgi:hypothetical protein